MQLISIGILGEYLGRIHEEIKGRPLYVVDEQINLAGAASPSSYFDDQCSLKANDSAHLPDELKQRCVTGMDRAYETKYHVQEDKHWWFKTRRDIVIKLLQTSHRNSKILEIGCSGGPLILALNERGYQDVHGIDISRDAIDLCKRRNIRNVFVMDGSKPAFDDGQFDIVIASDVLEHIEDEEKALSEWNRILKPAGKLIVFVPAFKILWSKHDEANHHYRRYSKSELIRVLKKADFEISRSSYWNFILFFPTSLVRLTERVCSKGRQNSKGDQLLELNSSLNEFLVRLVKAENVILRFANFPVGVSVFATAEKNVTNTKSIFGRSFSKPSVY